VVPSRALFVLGLVAGGCSHAYTQIGYEVSRSASGHAAAMVTAEDQPSGSVAVGFGNRGAAMEVAVHGQDVQMGADEQVAASAGLELKLRPLRYGPVSAFVHGGPQRAALFDRSTLAVTWGAGYSYGGGVMIGTGGVALVLDARADQIWYAGAEGSGMAGAVKLQALSVGLQLGR
jgi:hypothetical protein